MRSHLHPKGATTSLNHNTSQINVIDAYLHAGGPRFGPAQLALRQLERHAIDAGIIVLPPVCPDFAELRAAREIAGENVRLVGIPFGDTEAQRAELTAWQIAFGITGLRLMPHEMEPNADSIRLLGEAGRWLFTINPYDSADMQRTLLEWLEKYPKGRIICPHFFKPGPLSKFVEDTHLFKTLLSHPRFFVIFSRHGGTGTTRPYPHPDLKPWVEDIVAETGWEKVLWGSEYPVLYWRDEQIPQAANWIRELLPELSAENFNAFTCDNAKRLFFESPAPEDTAGRLPGWLPEPPYNGWAVPLAQKGIRLSPAAQEKLTAAFLDANTPENPVTLSEFIGQLVDDRLKTADSEVNQSS